MGPYGRRITLYNNIFYYYNKSKDTIFGKNIIKTIKWDRDVLSPNLILNILFQIVKSALDISNC